ncbi:MAG: hypothetical protein JSS70_20880, partial [Bacteroidetes bacterium]|nr:hypothetical protein [Bacteroidota bacterium]
MKNRMALYALVSILFAYSANAKVYYCSTSGSDSNSGTINSPFATWEKLISTLSAGDTGYIRGGTYRTTKGAASDNVCRIIGKSGTSSNPIFIWAYPGEQPVLNLDNVLLTAAPVVYALFFQNCNWLYFKGLRVTGLAQNPNGSNYTYGWSFEGGSNITVESCESDHNCEGFAASNISNLLYLNCDAHHLQDPYSPNPYNGSNGFSSTGGQPSSVSITFRGCRAWWCCDDGYDVFNNDGNITFDNCWSFWNGYIPGTFTSAGDGDGFKLGPTVSDLSTSTRHFLNNCVAFQNGSIGFDQNDARCINQLYNCTAFGNGNMGYHFGYQTSLNIAHVLKNNISFQDNSQVFLASSVVQSNNTWNGISATTSSFASLSNNGVDGARQSDGSLPNLQFLHLSSGSNLIDKGVPVLSLLFNGSAPDLGAFEYGGTSTPNQAPIANAGSNQTITLPTNTVNLDGSSSKDPDGSITSYSWIKTSGPSQGSISNGSSVSTTATNLVQGTYVFTLTVTDNSSATGSDSVVITVNAAANQSPVANAGANKTITLPTNSVSLDGSGSMDADGSITSYAWTKTSGPSQGSISNASSATTTATNLVQGTYVFKLTVTDNSNATGSDSIVITVNGVPNQAPVANAGGNQTITLPTNSVTLDGSGSTDADGLIASYAWTKVSGPSQGTISNASSATTTAINLVQGTYVFKLTVTDNSSATGSGSVVITVNGAPNQAPAANAGSNQTITLPTNSVTLDGSGSTDADGSIVSYAWSKVSGPSQGSISIASAATATATNLVQGTYIFKLTITDNGNATGSDSVIITVNAAANQLPVANAGANQTIILPTNTVTLDGSGSTDADGSIVSYAWSKVSGSSQGSISNASAATATATNLVQGAYVFKLTVKDNSNTTGTDSVVITVNAAPNQAPVANAGSNQT